MIKLDGSPSARRSGFGTRSLFVVILCFFTSESSSANAGTVLPVSTRLIVSMRTYGFRLRGEER